MRPVRQSDIEIAKAEVDILRSLGMEPDQDALTLSKLAEPRRSEENESSGIAPESVLSTPSGHSAEAELTTPAHKLAKHSQSPESKAAASPDVQGKPKGVVASVSEAAHWDNAKAAGWSVQLARVPMDSWVEDDQLVIVFDLPGVDPASIDIDVERNVLTLQAERKHRAAESSEMITAERPRGFSRQVILGDSLNAYDIQASYEAGVLSVRIPIGRESQAQHVETQDFIEHLQ